MPRLEIGTHILVSGAFITKDYKFLYTMYGQNNTEYQGSFTEVARLDLSTPDSTWANIKIQNFEECESCAFVMFPIWKLNKKIGSINNGNILVFGCDQIMQFNPQTN